MTVGLVVLVLALSASGFVASVFRWRMPALRMPVVENSQRLRGVIGPSIGTGRRASPLAVVVVLFVVGAGFRSPLLAVAAPLIVAQLARGHRTWRQRALVVEDELALLGVVDQVLHELRSGNSLSRAFVQAGSVTGSGVRSHPSTRVTTVPTGMDRYCGLVADVESGRSLQACLEAELDEPDGQSAFELLAVGVLVLLQNGGPATPAMQRLEETLRARQAAREEAAAQAAQATASAAVLAALPALFATLLMFANDKLASFYLHSVPGLVCVVGAALLVGAGWAWMQKMVWV